MRRRKQGLRVLTFAVLALSSLLSWWLVSSSRPHVLALPGGSRGDVEARTPATVRAAKTPVAREKSSVHTGPAQRLPGPIVHAPRSGASARFPIPPSGTRALHRTWVRARFGAAHDALGLDHLGGGGELYPPQGFVPTADGNLLVLDSNKKRIVEYDALGRMHRVLAIDELVMPADVTIARDGTIAVVDHDGLETNGILLLDRDGRSRRMLPKVQDGAMQGMYAVGDDFYFDRGSDGSVRAGDTHGDVSDETPGIYNYEDQEVIPGVVAPDGRTVISLGADLDSLARGELVVSALRDEPPVHLFTHTLTWPRALAAICFVQADAAGRNYVVVLDSRAPKPHEVLVCLDAAGQPVGAVDMGYSDGSIGTQLRRYNVAPTGGLVFQRLSAEGVSYEWYDCH